MTYEEIGYKEAAEIVGYVADKNSYIDWAVSDKQREAFKLAARVLRSVASANADAEKCFDVWWKDYWDEYFNEAGAKHIYLAGHAARQAEVRALTEQFHICVEALNECESHITALINRGPHDPFDRRDEYVKLYGHITTVTHSKEARAALKEAGQ